jgi:hypothetical protein
MTRQRVAASAAAALLLVLVAFEGARRSGASLASSPKSARDASFYRVEWQQVQLPGRLPAGGQIRALVSFQNAGSGTWPDAQLADPVSRNGVGAVRVGYCWWSAESDAVLVKSPRHTSLPWPLRPGETVTMPVTLDLPDTPGTYRLQFDLVEEGAAWFEAHGAPRWLLVVRVE